MILSEFRVWGGGVGEYGVWGEGNVDSVLFWCYSAVFSIISYHISPRKLHATERAAQPEQLLRNVLSPISLNFVFLHPFSDGHHSVTLSLSTSC